MRTILEPRRLLGEIGGIRTVFSNPSFYIRCILGGKRPRDWWYKISEFEAGFWEVLKGAGCLMRSKRVARRLFRRYFIEGHEPCVTPMVLPEKTAL